MTSTTLRTALALSFALGLGACKKKEADPKDALPPAAGQGAPPRAALPKVEPLKPGEQIVSGERATGTAFPKQEAKVAAKASGVITKIAVEEGQRVKKGDLLFSQDAQSMALNRQQAVAAVQAATVNLNATKTEYDRTKGLFEAGAANKAQMDMIQARYDAAQVQLQQAKVGVAQAGKMLGDTRVVAPFDGIVVKKLMNEGEMATMMPPSIVVIIQDQSILEVRARLPEKALATVKEGSIIKVSFSAIGDTRDAKVIRVGATVDPMTRTIEVVADVPNGDGKLRSGMLTEVDLGRGPPPAPPKPVVGETAPAPGGK